MVSGSTSKEDMKDFNRELKKLDKNYLMVDRNSRKQKISIMKMVSWNVKGLG